MLPIGFMTLVHPGALCLAIGSALVITGTTWLFLLRKMQLKHSKLISVLIFFIFLFLYAIVIQNIYDTQIISVEIIRPM